MLLPKESDIFSFMDVSRFLSAEHSSASARGLVGVGMDSSFLVLGGGQPSCRSTPRNKKSTANRRLMRHHARGREA